jgi:hypothetical protein
VERKGRSRVRRSLPWILIVIGGLVALGGIGMALLELSRLYNGVLDKPLDQPEGFEKRSSDQMLRYAIMAAPGALMVLIGKMLLKRRKARRA